MAAKQPDIKIPKIPEGAIDDLIGLVNKTTKSVAWKAFQIHDLKQIFKSKNKTKALQEWFNEVMQKEILLHGSPVQDLKTIKPQYGSYEMPDESVAWWLQPNRKEKLADQLEGLRGRGGAADNQDLPRASSIYASRQPKLMSTPEVENVVTTTRPAKVLKELKLGGKTETQILREFDKLLRRQGIRIK